MTSRLLPLVLLLLVLFFGSCQNDWVQYGVLTLKSSQGAELYVRREISGPNHDLLIISNSKDYCARPNPVSDYVFDNISDALYYKLDHDVLSLFRNGPLELKKDFHPSIQIDYHAVWAIFVQTANIDLRTHFLHLKATGTGARSLSVCGV